MNERKKLRVVLIPAALILLIAAGAFAVGPRVIFEDNFQVPDLSGWETAWFPKTAFGSLQVVDGAHQRDFGNHADRPADVDFDGNTDIHGRILTCLQR